MYLTLQPKKDGQQEKHKDKLLDSTTNYYADFYKKDVVFNSLGPVGDKVEEWTLKGAFIQSANFGDMSFDFTYQKKVAFSHRGQMISQPIYKVVVAGSRKRPRQLHASVP